MCSEPVEPFYVLPRQHFAVEIPQALNPTPYTLHSTSYTIHPTPYILHPTPYILHPTPYTMHPTPYTLHPTLYTLQPALYTHAPVRLNLIVQVKHLQSFLAHKKTPTPLGPPKDPRHRPTEGS